MQARWLDDTARVCVLCFKQAAEIELSAPRWNIPLVACPECLSEIVSAMRELIDELGVAEVSAASPGGNVPGSADAHVAGAGG